MVGGFLWWGSVVFALLCGVGCPRFVVVLVLVPYGPRIPVCVSSCLCCVVCMVVSVLVAGVASGLCVFWLVCRCVCVLGVKMSEARGVAEAG